MHGLTGWTPSAANRSSPPGPQERPEISRAQTELGLRRFPRDPLSTQTGTRHVSNVEIRHSQTEFATLRDERMFNAEVNSGMPPNRNVTFSNPKKVYFPSGFTKEAMIRYYVGIAETMLPHLRNRPITLIRFPDGVKGESFYEKNAPSHAPEWIKTHQVPRSEDKGFINYILINDTETLAWCANLGAIEFHPFLHRAPKLDRPTHVAFDLDPGEGCDILTCVEVAFLLKNLFQTLGLEVFPKVSGSKGIQLYLPLNTPVTYAATNPFAKSVAELMAQKHPTLIVSEMSKALRKGRVMIDWSQNVATKTTVAAYSMRGKRDEPFISTPVTWEELKKAAKSKRSQPLYFSPDEVLSRVSKRGDLFAPVLKLKQKLPKAFLSLKPSKKSRDSLSR